MPLKRQIWTGAGNQDDYHDANAAGAAHDILVANNPLSFGISKMLEDYQRSSEALLEWVQ